LTSSVLASVVLASAVLTGTMLTRAGLGSALGGTVVDGTVLSGTVLSGAVVAGAVLAGTVMTGTVLRRIRLAGPVLASTKGGVGDPLSPAGQGFLSGRLSRWRPRWFRDRWSGCLRSGGLHPGRLLARLGVGRRRGRVAVGCCTVSSRTVSSRAVGR